MPGFFLIGFDALPYTVEFFSNTNSKVISQADPISYYSLLEHLWSVAIYLPVGKHIDMLVPTYISKTPWRVEFKNSDLENHSRQLYTQRLDFGIIKPSHTWQLAIALRSTRLCSSLLFSKSQPLKGYFNREMEICVILFQITYIL